MRHTGERSRQGRPICERSSPVCAQLLPQPICYPGRVLWVQGGKVDDVTVLVALVVEEQPPAEPTPAQPAPELERAASAVAEPAQAGEAAAA